MINSGNTAVLIACRAKCMRWERDRVNELIIQSRSDRLYTTPTLSRRAWWLCRQNSRLHSLDSRGMWESAPVQPWVAARLGDVHMVRQQPGPPERSGVPQSAAAVPPLQGRPHGARQPSFQAGLTALWRPWISSTPMGDFHKCAAFSAIMLTEQLMAAEFWNRNRWNLLNCSGSRCNLEVDEYISMPERGHREHPIASRALTCIRSIITDTYCSETDWMRSIVPIRLLTQLQQRGSAHRAVGRLLLWVSAIARYERCAGPLRRAAMVAAAAART